MGCAGSCALGGQQTGRVEKTMHLTEPTGGERHVFHEKVLRKKRLCAACSEPVLSQGSVCRVCKITSHKKCEGKVPPGCSSPPPADMCSTKSLNLKQRSSLPRSFSLDHVIQRSYDLDLTYITERIISVFFPTSLEEQRYRSNLREVASMLRSKHEDKYLLFNLSKKRHDISKLNPKVQDFFWPDCHAPSLDVICSICKAMEAWLNSDTQHVVVLHCKGNQGKTGVVIASYMHYSKVSASVDQALSTLAMRKFCEDKASSSLHPSQRRYINYFGGLLSGTIKISSDMLSLQCVLLPVIPALQTDGGFCPFLKIYQSMQLVYTSGIYLSLGDGTGQKRQLCISLEPALLLKGDIMVKCYHKRCKPHEREVLFRLQFHTCTIHNTHLCFSKDQLDCANTDDKFPDDAAVEFIFSSGQDKVKGREVFRKDPSITVDYDITDPLVRFDSYENLNVHYEDSLEDLNHTRGPLDGSLYARVNKKSTPLASTNGSPEQHGRLLSVSSDSGHSSAPTERLEETPQKSLPTAAEQEDLNKLLGGFGVTVKQEGEPQYSQVLKHEQAVTQNGHQRQKMDERSQDLQHRDHSEEINRNIQAKMAREARLQYSPQWSGVSDEGTSQSLPLTSPSWEEQRESSGGTPWEGQRDHEAAILEEEMGQFGSLAMYPGRRPLLSRHCSCRIGYAGPNIEGPPNRSYFRAEGFLDPRGAPGASAVLQGGHYPVLYGDQDRRRLYRSLSEGPQHYPNQTQSPPKRGSLRENRQYICQPPRHEHIMPPMCPCSHCQSTACYPVPNMWSLEGGKMPPMQPFHRGELPSHLSQPYGQSLQHNHDIAPPCQIPLDKMHYGFSIPHGEDSLHFTHFTDTGYGHIYPHFLHPSYLPTNCPPNGYGALSTCMPTYNQPGGQSPPGSVSPIVTSSCAPRRMSGDTLSAGSPGELTPPQQQDFTDHGVHRNAPSFQPQKPPAAAPATSLSAITHPSSVVHAQNPMHTSTSANGHSAVQTDDFAYPQSPVHASTPINTHCQPLQMQQNPIHTQNTAVQTQSSILRHSSSSSPQRQLLQSDHATQPQNPSAQQKPSPPRNVHFHSQVHTQPPVTQANSFMQKDSPPAQSQNSEQIQNTLTQVVHNGRMTQNAHTNSIVPTQGFTHPLPSVHSQSEGKPTSLGQVLGPSPHAPLQSLSPATQASTVVQTQSSSSHLYSPVNSHSSAVQASIVVPSHGALTQINIPKQSSVHMHSPVCTDTPCIQTNNTVHTQSPVVQSDSTVQVHSTVHTQMPSLALHSPVHKPSPQAHSTVHIQTASLQTFRNPCNQNQSVPNYRPLYAHNSAQASSPVSTDRPGVTVSNVASTTSEVNSVTLHSSSPPHVSKVAPQMPVNPTTRTVEQVTRQPSVKSVPFSNETSISTASQYSAPTGTSYPQQPAPMSNPVTPQRRSITISLTETPIISHGMEVPTSPPQSPMGSQCELQSPSPTPLFPISTAYYSGSPCPPNAQPPMLPEKCHTPATGDKSGTLQRSNELREDKPPSLTKDVQQDFPPVSNFVQDSSKFWYRPNISREQAIALLRGAEPGSFLIRDSNSFRGAYGLALKVSSPPPNVQTQPCRDPAEQLVRHFLIETGPKGVKIKGSPIEPHFGSLSALVSQHSVTPLSLPCRLRVPDKDLTEQNLDVAVPTNMSTAADLLRQGAACCVLYLGSVDTESLTGPQAISKASSAILTPPRSTATTVHFKVSDQGITLTDSQRKLFFRRHYPVSSVTFCSADPQDRRWTNPDRTTSKVFGFVARKAGSTAENVCHLFAELDPEQPASAIVNFITKVMLGAHRR